MPFWMLAALSLALSLLGASCGSSFVSSTSGCTVAADVTLPSKGIPYDWSHKHLAMAGAGDAAKRAHDPRLLYQYLRHQAAECSESSEFSKSSTRVDWHHNLGAVMADGTYPAKYSFNLPGQVPTCTDFVVYGLNVAGASTQANLIGLTNLYSGGSSASAGLCNSNTGVYQLYPVSYTSNYAATLKFAYNGSTISGTITNSVALSLDGTKVAYVESNSTSGKSVLHVVSLPSGTDLPSSNTSASANVGTCYPDVSGNYQTSCGAVATTPSSILSIPSSGWSAADSMSSVWIDYGSDAAYVGTDNGVVHKIQNVFCTTTACKSSYVAPSEVTTGGWPVTLSGAGALTSPVEDANGVIYVSGATSGKLYAISATGTVTTSTQSFMANSIVDSPLVDIDGNGVTQALYWFSNSIPATSPTVRQPQVVQTNSTLSTVTPYSLLLNGTSYWPTDSTANITLHSGTFDNAFYNNRVGNLWACGWWQPSGYNGNYQGIVRFGLSGSTVSEDTSKVYAQTSPPWTPANVNTCAPMSEALNNSGVDRLFVSSYTGYAMSTGTCASYSSCLAAFDIASSGSTYSLSASGSYNLVSAGNSDVQSVGNTYTTGIISDSNVDPTSSTCGTSGTSTCAQAASIYFNYGPQAIKLTQSGLQ